MVLTEDSSEDAPTVHAAMIRAMLGLLEPTYDRGSVALEPATAPQRLAMRGNGWDGTGPEYEPRRRTLVRDIATRICQNNISFVVFHYDGDRPWATHANCPRHATFRHWIVTRVQQLIPPRFSPEQRARALARLITVVPFYSVEAWLFQNTAVATGLCMKHHGGAHAADFDAWASDRGALDEVVKPKEVACLHDKHNRDLATENFPAQVVHGAEKSFFAAVETFRACVDLRGALAAIARAPSTGAVQAS